MKFQPGFTDPFISPVSGKVLTYYQLPNLIKDNIWIGNEDNIATPTPIILMSNLPNLTKGKIWVGNDENRPIESDFTPLGSYLPEGKVFVGNSENVAEPTQQIRFENLPPLGQSFVPDPITGELVGQVYEGTESGVPKASYIVSGMFTDIAILNAKFYGGHFVMNSGSAVGFPLAQFLDRIGIGMTKLIAGGYFALAIPGTDYVTPAILDEAIGVLQDEIDELQQQMLDVLDILETLQGEIDLLEAQIEYLSAEIVVINSEIADLQAQMLDVLDILETMQGEIDLLEAQIEAINAEIVVINDEIAELQAQMLDVLDILETLQAEIDLLQEQIESINAEIVVINDEIEQLQAQMLDVLDILETMQGEIDLLQQEVEALNAEIVVINDEIVTLNAQVAAIQGQIAAINGQIALIQAEIESIYVALAVLQAEIAFSIGIINDDINDLQNQIDEIWSEINNLILVIDGIESNIISMQQEIFFLTQLIEDQILALYLQIQALRLNTIPADSDVSIYGYRLTDVADPVLSTDAATMGWVESVIGTIPSTTVVTLSGDVTGSGAIDDPIVTTLNKTLNEIANAGDISISGYKVIDAEDPINPQDLTTKNYVDSVIDGVPSSTILTLIGAVSGSGALNDPVNTTFNMTLNEITNADNLSIGGYRLTDVATPILSTDGVNKEFVEETVNNLPITLSGFVLGGPATDGNIHTTRGPDCQLSDIPAGGDVSIDNFNLKNVADPNDIYDGVNLNFLWNLIHDQVQVVWA